ncbi:hypothetical protein LWI29_011865 [Acer saccharum]|uniref:Uncharacterized protein n=1 Tax=Acer saccharum TaxID=4024 RepID=A0AA39W6Z0_ACESA|nr:hypothetical protein LWI29_011865 [Acer saccharum]
MAATTKTTTLNFSLTTKVRVVYAEAGKDFVDFLFGLMQVPIGTIMGSLLEISMPSSGSFGRIYVSVMNLNPSYLQSNVSKDVILKPKTASSSTIDSIPLLKNFVSRKRKHESSYYGQYGTYGDAKARRVNPSSFDSLYTSLSDSSYTSSSDSSSKSRVATSRKEKQGFVRGLVKYIVMDNMKVMPISSFSIISLLNQYRVNDFSSLEKETITINFDKGLELVKASFASDTVLTDVSSESPGTSRRNCDSESILLDFMREAFSD